ncbi:MAG: Calx-beta domain-containing protein, partial [Gammaproteobacteria bacterium]
MKLQRFYIMILMAFALLLAACSSGGGDDGDIVGTGEKPKTIVGTAAAGAPISLAPLAAKSRNGNKVSGTTEQNGKYSLTIPSTGSVLLKVDAPNGKSLYSIAGDSGTTNIHPFTDLVIRNWFKVQGLDIDAEFASNSAFSNLPTPEEVNEIKAAIRNLIAQALIQQGVPTDFDLISSDFDANGQGFDQFLDFSLVVIINNNFTISLTDPATDVENEIVSSVGLDTNLALPDNQAPTMPQNLRAVPASATDIVVVWDPSSDNIGVAGYNVYRDGELVATTPYPVYTDTGLVGGTDYCYAVEAFDGAGTPSPQAKTPQPCAQTTADDNTPPDMPTALAATSLGPNTISLTWIQSGINDVVAFDIYRGPIGNITEKVASVTSTAHTDYNLSSNTEYCYQVVARDGAGNTSSASDPACATTDVGTNPPPAGDSFVSFSAATYQVTETGAVAVITVNRSGDNTAAVSVEYATSDGTATAEQDYTPVSGVLSWGTLDDAPKTIRIPIQPDLVSDNNETILLSLSNFTNTSAGATTNATVTISDAACPGVLDSNVTTSTTISQCTVVTGNISVSGGVLTINPGVTLMFESSSSLDISATGALSAVGTADLPILFTGVNKTPGSWGGVDFRYTNNVSNALDYLTIEYGGDSATSANLTTTANSSSITRLAISNTTLRNGFGYGLSIDPYTNLGVNGLSNVVITGNGEYPVEIPANLIGALDPNSDYAGNGVNNDKDEIQVTTSSSTINTDQTWPALNVPYLMGSANYTVSAALTIAPGTEF